MGDPEMYLHEMGFSEYEAAAYLALLRNGTGTANEVAKAGDIPQSRVYDVLKKLDEKGFVVTQPGRPKKFGSVDPERAMAQYGEYKENQFEEEYKETMLIGEKFVESVDSTPGSTGTSDEPDIVWSYHTEHQLFEVYEQLCRGADEEIRMVTGVENIERKVGRFDELMTRISEDGVDIRVVLPETGSLSPSIEDSITGYAALRYCGHVEAQIYLFDGADVLIVFQNESDDYVGLTVQNQALGTTLAHMFDVLWAGLRVDSKAVPE
jgi:sugar-specific transcriptional regulator TrmB